MPRKEISQLQHSRKFVKKEDPAIMRQTSVVTGDCYIFRRTPHVEPHFTKSDVRLKL